MKPYTRKRRPLAPIVLAVSLTLALVGILLTGAVPVLGFLHRLAILLCCVTAWCALLLLPNQLHSVRSITRALKWATALALVLVAFSFVAVEVMILSCAEGDAQPEGDVLVVLGAGLNGSTPSLSLQNRLLAAQDYLEQHSEAVAVLSGGQGPDEEISEALAMQRYLLARGVAQERLLLEQKSHNTHENLLYSKEVLEQALGAAPEHIIIVSNGFHLFRARFLAARVGFEADLIAAPLPDIPLLPLNNYLREYFAVVKSFLTDR